VRLGVVLTQARVLLRLRGREERDQHEEHTIQHRGSAWNSAVRAAGGEVYRIKVSDQVIREDPAVRSSCVRGRGTETSAGTRLSASK